MWDDVAAGCPAQPIDKLLQRQALGGQCVRFVVCDYFRSVFYGKSETPVCPHLLRNPRRNQDRPQILGSTHYTRLAAFCQRAGESWKRCRKTFKIPQNIFHDGLGNREAV